LPPLYTVSMEDQTIVLRIPSPDAPGLELAVMSTAADPETISVNQDSPTSPQVLFCSGFHSSMRGTKCEALSTHALENDYLLTRFDYRGHGESDGEAIDCTLKDWLNDTLAVIDTLKGPIIIVGSSMGAWLATRAALLRPERISGLLLIAAAPDFVSELIEPELDHQQRWQLETGEVVFLPSDYDEPPRPITQALIDSGRELNLLDSDELNALTIPVRMVHGTGDKDVPWQFSQRLMEGLGGNARLTLLHQKDHRLSDDESLGVIKRELSELIDELNSET